MSAGGTQRKKASATTFFFYSTEIVFAVIAATAEYAIYQAYSATDFAASTEAGARAAFMEICIIFFGIAAVKAYQNNKKMAMYLANAITLIFSLVSVWFIHESAQVYANTALLAKAYGNPLFGFLSGNEIDPWLIASLPLFVVAMNWLAPIIVMDGQVVVETPEEMQARQQRELLERQHKAHMAVLNAKGRRAQIQALRGKDDAKDEEKANESTDDSTPNDGTKDAPLPEERPRIEPHLVALSWHDKDAQWWDKAALIAWALDEYSTTITEAKANTFLQESSKDEQGRPARIASQGNPYTANKDEVMAYAKKMLRLKKAPRNAKTKTADNVVPFAGDRAAVR